MLCWCIADDGVNAILIESEEFENYDDFYEWFDKEYGWDVIDDGDE